MHSNNFRDWRTKPLAGAFALMMLLGVAGCQQRMVGQLLGRWVGSPDTASARAEREAQKYGDASPVSEATPKSVDPSEITDWQHYDATVHLEFVSRDQIVMSLDGHSRPRSGTWRIVATTPVGCTIEVDMPTETEGIERRRFQLDLDQHEGKSVGFTFMEVGADRQLGSLYFRRPEGM